MSNCSFCGRAVEGGGVIVAKEYRHHFECHRELASRLGVAKQEALECYNPYDHTVYIGWAIDYMEAMHKAIVKGLSKHIGRQLTLPEGNEDNDQA